MTPDAAQTATEAVCAALVSGIGDWAPSWLADNTALLTPIVILASVALAAWGVRTNKRLARTRATLDMIERVESTDFYQENHKKFLERRRNNTFEELLNPQSDSQRTDRQAILDYLNNYELVALGIKNRILDRDFYKHWMGTPFCRDWDAAAGFIQEERWKFSDGEWSYHDKLFKHFQALAISWGAQIDIGENTSGPPEQASEAQQGFGRLIRVANSSGKSLISKFKSRFLQ